LKSKAASDPGTGYLYVKSEYLRRFNVVWLPPLGFNDTFAMVIAKPDADKLSAPKLSAATERGWHLGVGYEFLTRADGLAQLNRAYHLRWEKTPVSMDLGLLYQALRQHRVTMAAGNSTDALLSDPAFTVLDDDQHAFPSYSACFLVRKQVSDSQPAVTMALSMLSNHLDAETMRRLNRRVDQDHQSIARVAKDFLAAQP
jgi:osmoprotectant transport system substrate-binding protein